MVRERAGRQCERSDFLKAELVDLQRTDLRFQVEDGKLSWAAAPDGPETQPPVAASAVSGFPLFSNGLPSDWPATLPRRRGFVGEPAWIH
jgi:hypothetical protein